jgi:ABC-2 type transport system permease protein
MDVSYYVIQIAFFEVIYLHTPFLGDWNRDQIFVFLGAVFVVDSLKMTIFANNTWWFPIFVNKGDLDFYLIRPVSTLFFLTLRDFAANSFVNVLIAFGIFSYALSIFPEPLASYEIALFLLMLFSGVILLFSIHMIFLIPVFWLHSSHGLQELFWSLEQYAERPHDIFQGWLKRILITVFPIAMAISYPTKLLFEGRLIEGFPVVFGITGASFLVMLMFWRLGLRSYSSASS